MEKRVLIGLMVAGLMMVQVASATVVLSHYGDTNPSTEGWGGAGSATETAIAGEAWEIDCAAGQNRWYYSGLAPDWITQGLAEGFVYRISAKVEGDQATGQQMDLFFHGPMWVLQWGQSGSDIILTLMATHPNEQTYTITGGAGSYHLYEIIYDPTDGLADIAVDGSVVVPDLAPGDGGSIERVLWGNTDSVDSTIRYGMVELDILPEPVTVGFLALGSLALLRRRRRA